MSTYPTALNTDWRQMIRSSSEDLDLRQLEVFARLSPTRRLEVMFEMCDVARQLVIAGELHRDPNLTEIELAQRVRARFDLSRQLDEAMSMPITADSATTHKGAAAS
jgi:hypothetical protein